MPRTGDTSPPVATPSSIDLGLARVDHVHERPLDAGGLQAELRDGREDLVRIVAVAELGGGVEQQGRTRELTLGELDGPAPLRHVEHEREHRCEPAVLIVDRRGVPLAPDDRAVFAQVAVHMAAARGLAGEQACTLLGDSRRVIGVDPLELCDGASQDLGLGITEHPLGLGGPADDVKPGVELHDGERRVPEVRLEQLPRVVL